MRIEQRRWSEAGGWEPGPPGELGAGADAVLVFGSTELLDRVEPLGVIGRAYPNAVRIGCSTAGEILSTQVTDETVVVTAIHFEHSSIRVAEMRLDEAADSLEAGRRLARELLDEDLVHVLVLCDGTQINGSELVRGLRQELPPGVQATGGLAGDGSRFERTLVFSSGPPETGRLAALGLYGRRLRVGCGSLGGWDPFGPERRITRSTRNVLYELDGKSALELYKRYLGEFAADLPASGLLFPLSLRPPGGSESSALVRTILSVDESEQSMTFAGDMPLGHYARLMKANFDRLIDGATLAAKTSNLGLDPGTPELAVLISCFGRKMVLKQRIEEEVESVRRVLGRRPALAGFYSYGEISPFSRSTACELHNQTMTITTIAET